MTLADDLKDGFSKLPLKEKMLYGAIDPKVWDNFIGPVIYFGSLLVGGPYPANFFDESSD